MQDGRKVRTNGFERPFHPLQVLSWVVFGSDVLVYVAFGLPLIETAGAKVAVAILYIASVVVLVLATVKATSCDPADPHVRLQDSEIQTEDMETMPYCTMCNVPVYARSKHCRACNKCVTVFDHHCMWLNNCVGSANYRAFFVTVSSVAVMIGIVLSSCLYLLIDYGVNNEEFEKRVQSIAVYRSFPKEFFLGLLITMLFVNTPLFLLDLQLVLLHAFLWSQDLTTYEYIMNKREMTREGKKAGQNIGQRARSLPSCMDWIVFSRCGQKRRTKRKDSIERIATKADPMDAEAGKAELGEKGASRPVDASPSPPGSTVDAADCPGNRASAVDASPAGDRAAEGYTSAPSPGKAAGPAEDEGQVELTVHDGGAPEAAATGADRPPEQKGPENEDAMPALADGSGGVAVLRPGGGLDPSVSAQPSDKLASKV
mmetsp:Transcript_93775/g.292214  ORF Transcript_93775/g.292214 Transcript_93775/m.292214 type:complete len:429 (-) Transcript_93775:235-1521(-)|eukprot:CAMPEP_0204527212 /NCGR_PEP_ID=MMETSP0661-20131031/8854_1 /ASSEMBLY_ACC=CAM_ASM_000606 /TAXON_ID=109239 /ORGANISM="Alexandrium margalefi, Strain AMGDE01CS-322" /LENGTH=428 /DNA_ID=CAMNT_0051533097 /DNA_START=85 /DNA_END=1371 /DNA_ORIENTATION=-